jgi:hypothetical protein
MTFYRKKVGDTAQARSMIAAAAADMSFATSLAVTEASATTIVRGVYENFRLLGNALLVADGIETSDHTEMIGALLRLKVVTSRPLPVLDNLRRLRHNINYRGYKPSVAEAEDAISIAKALFEPLNKEVLRQISS